MDYLKSIIYEKCLKPVLNVYVDNAMFLNVQFDEHTIKHKINQDLRSFFAIVQQLNIKIISKDKKYCINQPTGFFDLLGITENDTVQFSNEDATMNVYFIKIQEKEKKGKKRKK